MRVRLILTAAAASCLLCLTAPAGAQSASTSQSGSQGGGQRNAAVARQDRKFLDYAAEDNQAEIQLCLLAEKKAQEPAIKAFARLMVDDHVEIESRLAALINAEGVKVPNGMGKEGRTTYHKLAPLSGAGFDAHFLRAQIKDHSNDIKKFSDETKTTKDGRIRRFASETVPILKQHLALAQTVDKAMGQNSMASQKH